MPAEFHLFRGGTCIYPDSFFHLNKRLLFYLFQAMFPYDHTRFPLSNSSTSRTRSS
jgi:hypothetical protein